MQVRAALRYAVATIDSFSCFCGTTSIVMSQSPPLISPLSDFYRAPSGNDHFFLAITAVNNECQTMKHTDELFITAYPHPD